MEDELARVVDALAGLVWTALPGGLIEFANQRWRDYTGWGPSDGGENTWQAVVHPDDLPGVAERLRSAPASPEPIEVEARLRGHNGEYRWFLIRAAPLADESGRLVKWCGMTTDIEHRKRAEEATREREVRLQSVLDDLPALVVLQLLEMIASGRALPDVLAALCTCFEQAAPDCLCGVYPVDWSGPTFHDAVAPSLPASYLAPVEGLAVGVEDIESDPRWRESPYRAHVLAHGLRSVWSTPISSLDGRVLGTFCIYRRTPGTPSPRQQELIAQITHIASIAIDRERKEAELRRSEAFLAQAQRLTLTGSLWWKTATGEITWSDETFRIFGYDPSVAVTLRLILQRVHPQDLDLVRHVIAQAEDGHDVDCECRLVMPDRTVKHVHIVAHGVRDRNDRLEIIGAIQDVTGRRHSEETLGELRSELTHVARVTSLGALTASIAHEVNQPLSGIITNANTCLRMLAIDPPNIDGARETARRTIRDGNRASEVVTRLRALYARKTPTLEPVDLNEATREVIALSRSELVRSKATMRAELAEDLPIVMGDRVQLQQVIMNLLRNAAESMSGIDDRPREIVITTSMDDGDRVCLSVRDSGVGFGPQGAAKVFDAFYTTKPDGMGIGLSVSRSIIESHRGRLWAVPNDGPGVTFSFAIPCGLDFGVHAHQPRAAGKREIPREAHTMGTAR